LTRESLFSPATPQAVIDACADRVESESRRAMWFDAMFRIKEPERISAPVLVLGAEHDRSIAPTEVHATASAYRTEAEVFPGMGHNMMLEPGWPAVAQRIESWLGERGL
jgi:pimeloyl-ACP methyl ester carboxylesterase